MDFLIENWILVLIAATSGGLLVAQQLRGASGGGASVSPAEAVTLLNREKAVMLDVGEPAEYAEGHATPARALPFGQLEGSRLLPSDKNRPVVLICPTGARARRAVDLLKKAGHARVVAVAGGTAAWRDAQLPIERGAAEAADSPPAKRKSA